MATTAYAETTPRLTLDQRHLLMAHLLRLPSLGRMAQQHLTAELFYEADEPYLRAVWAVARNISARGDIDLFGGDHASVRNVLRSETRAYVESNPLLMPPECLVTLDQFFTWAFDGLPAAEIINSYGLDLLQRFLQERFVQEPLINAINDSGENSLTNLPVLLREAQERHAVVEQLGAAGASLADDWQDFQSVLNASRGRTLIGLRTGMPTLDERTLGLRDLIALGAMPGIGKTTLALQLGINILTHNPDAVLLFLSLEMPRHSLYTRLLCNRSGLDWKTVKIGSPSLRGNRAEPWLTPQDQERLDRAVAELRDSGIDRRMIILDQKTLGPDFTAETVLSHLRRAKADTQTTRAFIPVDYLQLLPAPGVADLEADRRRVQFLKDLVDGTRTPENPAGDCVFAITEIRKPPIGRKWHGQLADLMGSARLPYALDAAFVFRRIEDADEEIYSYDWSTVGVPSPSAEAFENAGVAPILLELVKGRDGFSQGSIGLAFEFTRSRFVEVNRDSVRGAGLVRRPPPRGASASNGLPAPLTSLDPFSKAPTPSRSRVF